MILRYTRQDTRREEVRPALGLIWNGEQEHGLHTSLYQVRRKSSGVVSESKDPSRILVDKPILAFLGLFPLVLGRGDFPNRVIPRFPPSSPHGELK